MWQTHGLIVAVRWSLDRINLRCNIFDEFIYVILYIKVMLLIGINAKLNDCFEIIILTYSNLFLPL